jgi:siroheme synthase (precorrin-2 oxidase/ferrochelatase)
VRKGEGGSGALGNGAVVSVGTGETHRGQANSRLPSTAHLSFISPSDMNPQLGQDASENNFTSKEKSYAFDYAPIDKALSLIKTAKE